MHAQVLFVEPKKECYPAIICVYPFCSSQYLHFLLFLLLAKLLSVSSFFFYISSLVFLPLFPSPVESPVRVFPCPSLPLPPNLAVVMVVPYHPRPV